ncbi:metalloregulator ArsR/SmtB family transcription factor [Pediococcus inopinatus]|uniref:Metalloregulator ArsR/SmtB family transcription factor n=1 Tax=Pediococcus inopinatus TaxID=114090 RepID=A0ABZ0Q289_9LACO|nr:metalloregulator ArsR/SmtB family transcription factor [Pediococcus inopinatus]WPC19266.1 metalloregulator ArsR/SmtB family transcription factor [Pediococcus inopinatus]WPC21054.1 metalloregulator ArsR/SmtB family transcription factor [Pediococcus inopinatus]
MDKEAQNYKNQLYSELARLGKGISSDKRLEILDLLTQSSKSVDSISKEAGISVANTSRHLQVLKGSHLVKTVKDGNRVIYSLTSKKIGKLIHLLVKIGEEELSEMRAIEQQADHEKGVKIISLEQAFSWRRNSVLLDVRPVDEYEAGHVDGSINIPLSELENNYDKLPKGKRIIVYCRGRLCVNSNQATRSLNEHGFDASSLNSSYQEWRELSYAR